MGRRKIADRATAPPSYMGGHTFLSKDGYILEHCPSHPRAGARDGMVPQHILVAEARLGSHIGKEYEVHHVDRDKKNNDPDNLVVLTPSEHNVVHRQEGGFGIHCVDIGALYAHFSSGGSVLAACRKFRVSAVSIHATYPELVPKKKHLPTREDVYMSVQEHGTAKAVGKALGVSDSTLRKHFRDLLPEKGARLTEALVLEALSGRTTAEAARWLGVHHMTLRNGFDHLLSKRRKPCSPGDPETVRIVLEYAKDEQKTSRQLSRDHGISQAVAAKICKDHGVEWVRNYSRKGVSGRPKKSTHLASTPGGQMD